MLTYNIEDCEALERTTGSVVRLCQIQTEATNSTDTDIVFTDLLKRESPHHLGTNKFLTPDLEYINKSAYWDYQRDKVYVRSSQQLKRISKKITKSHPKALPINKVFKCPPPTCCTKCKSTNIRKHERISKIVYDLKFGSAGIKRWIVEYYFDRYKCFECGATFFSSQRTWTRSKYGLNLLAYLIYQNIELRLSQQTVTQSLNQLFGFNLGISFFNGQKTRAAQIYEGTYEAIKNKIVNGKLIHADETTVSIEGKNSYVWVFANLEDVAYHYTETRDGDFLQELLQKFNGVLVSDFYAAYDLINCPQQKCLIHLIRDLNDDLHKQPFDEELKALACDFTMLLKPMIETIDRFGLKAYFLRKHKIFVERFYKALSKRNYKSEIAIKTKSVLKNIKISFSHSLIMILSPGIITMQSIQ